MDIAELLSFTKNSGASDLFLSAGCEPIIRRHEELKRVFCPPLSKKEIDEMMSGVFTEEQEARFRRSRELNFAIELEGVGIFRVGCFAQPEGRPVCIWTAFRLVAEDELAKS